MSSVLTLLVNIRHRQPLHNLDPPSQLLQRRLRILRPQICTRLLTYKNEIVGHQRRALRDSVLLHLVSGDFRQRDGQRSFDAEYRVTGLVGVAFEVESTIYQIGQQGLRKGSKYGDVREGIRT